MKSSRYSCQANKEGNFHAKTYFYFVFLHSSFCVSRHGVLRGTLFRLFHEERCSCMVSVCVRHLQLHSAGVDSPAQQRTTRVSQLQLGRGVQAVTFSTGTVTPGDLPTGLQPHLCDLLGGNRSTRASEKPRHL